MMRLSDVFVNIAGWTPVAPTSKPLGQMTAQDVALFNDYTAFCNRLYRIKAYLRRRAQREARKAAPSGQWETWEPNTPTNQARLTRLITPRTPRGKGLIKDAQGRLRYGQTYTVWPQRFDRQGQPLIDPWLTRPRDKWHPEGGPKIYHGGPITVRTRAGRFADEAHAQSLYMHLTPGFPEPSERKPRQPEIFQRKRGLTWEPERTNITSFGEEDVIEYAPTPDQAHRIERQNPDQAMFELACRLAADESRPREQAKARRYLRERGRSDLAGIRQAGGHPEDCPRCGYPELKCICGDPCYKDKEQPPYAGTTKAEDREYKLAQIAVLGEDIRGLKEDLRLAWKQANARQMLRIANRIEWLQDERLERITELKTTDIVLKMRPALDPVPQRLAQHLVNLLDQCQKELIPIQDAMRGVAALEAHLLDLYQEPGGVRSELARLAAALLAARETDDETAIKTLARQYTTLASFEKKEAA